VQQLKKKVKVSLYTCQPLSSKEFNALVSRRKFQYSYHTAFCWCMDLHSQYRGNDCRYYIYFLWQDV